MKHQIISRVRQPDHIHTPGDGRGSRQVYIDGLLCSRVVKADTQAGTVEVVTNPVTVDLETGHIKTLTLHGRVTVIPHHPSA